MDYSKYNVIKLKKIAKEQGLKKYSKLNKAELISLIKKNSSKSKDSSKKQESSSTKTLFDVSSSSSIPLHFKTECLPKIYLSGTYRKLLAEKIKQHLIKVSKTIKVGKQCLNKKDSKSTLLKYLEPLKMLGMGTFGNVYEACAPVNKQGKCIHNAQQFAVKLGKLEHHSAQNPHDPNYSDWHEEAILKKLDILVENNYCPNLPLLFDSYMCEKCDFEFSKRVQDKDGKERRELQHSTHPCAILITELAAGDLTYWFKEKRTEVELNSALFQILAGLHSIQNGPQIVNNDVKSQNILYYNVTPGGYFKYIIHGKEYLVPNCGHLFILNDFGVSLEYNPYWNLFKSKSQNLRPLGKRFSLLIKGQDGKFEFTPLTSNKEGDFYYGEAKKNTTKCWKVRVKEKGQYEYQCGYIPFINRKGLVYLSDDGGWKLTQIQKITLKEYNITTDDSKQSFYNFPAIIPPTEFAIDIHDVINIFLGGRRASQDGNHEPPKYVSNIMKPLLERFRFHDIYTYWNLYKEPYHVLAGFFIESYFNKVYTFPNLEKALGTKIIETFKLSKGEKDRFEPYCKLKYD